MFTVVEFHERNKQSTRRIREERYKLVQRETYTGQRETARQTEGGKGKRVKNYKTYVQLQFIETRIFKSSKRGRENEKTNSKKD